jgi:hypothetical protein
VCAQRVLLTTEDHRRVKSAIAEADRLAPDPRWRGPGAGRGRRHGAQDAEEAVAAGAAAGGWGFAVSKGHALPDHFDRGPV